MSISPSDTVYIQLGSRIQSIGSGYYSEEEVEEYIEDNFDEPKEYNYGVFKNIGSVEIEEPEPKEETLSETTLDRLDEIEKRAEGHGKVGSFGRVDNPRYNTNVTRYTQKIRYADNEVDFSITLPNSLFDDVPISTLDMDVESRVKSIFEEIVGEQGVFLGYDSGYASRGRKNPYVRVVGRVKRDTDKDRTLRELDDLDFIAGLYWSEENVMPVKSYLNPAYNYDDASDIMTVFDIKDSPDSFEDLSDETMDKLDWIISQIEEQFELECMWLGQIQFNRDFDHTCAGFRYTGDE